jgi:hypothetical protein
MKSRGRSFLLLALLAVSPAPVAAQKSRRAPGADARQTVQSFFRFHFADGMDFTAENVEQRRRWLTPELYALLRDEFRKEADRAKAQPDEAPFIDGDPFTNSQEYPQSFRLGKSVQSGETAVVQVIFVWPGRTARERSERDVSVTLRRGGRRWLIANVKGEGEEDLLTLLRKPRG